MSHLALGQSGTTMAKYTQTCILVPEKKRDLSQELKLQHSQNRNNAINVSLPQFLLSGWKRKKKTGLCPPGMVIMRLVCNSNHRSCIQTQTKFPAKAMVGCLRRGIGASEHRANASGQWNTAINCHLPFKEMPPWWKTVTNLSELMGC